MNPVKAGGQNGKRFYLTVGTAGFSVEIGDRIGVPDKIANVEKEEISKVLLDRIVTIEKKAVRRRKVERRESTHAQ